MDNLVIDTPEQIPLEFPLAGIGSRFLALAVDTSFQVVAGAALFLVAIAVPGSPGPSLASRKVWAWALLVLLEFILQFGYFTLFEALWNGQTPGKRWTHLRVIQDSGRPITAYDAVARNMLRIVDSLPVLYGVAILTALLNARNKRLGDYVAGTVVVHEKPVVLEAGSRWDLESSSAASRYEVSRMSPEQFQLIEAYLLRRSQLAASVRAETARKITQRLAAQLELTAEDERTPETLLENLATAYRARARFR